MKRMPLLWTVAALLVLAVAAGAAYVTRYHRGGFFRPPNPEAALEADVLQLGLDAQKTERVRAIFASARQHQRELRGRLEQAFDEMGALLDQDQPDEAAVLAQAERIGALRTESDQARLRTLLAVREQLSAEERGALKQKLRDEPRRRGGRRRGPPRPEH